MRVDTLILIPVVCITVYSLISVQSQISNYSEDKLISCDSDLPFSYSIEKEKSQCGWNRLDYMIIMICFIADLISCLMSYFKLISLCYQNFLSYFY